MKISETPPVPCSKIKQMRKESPAIRGNGEKMEMVSQVGQCSLGKGKT